MQLNKISAILKDLDSSGYSGYYGDAISEMNHGAPEDPVLNKIYSTHMVADPVTAGASVPAPSKSVPSVKKIDDWNNFLAYFNESIKKEDIDPASLDKGEDVYARDKFGTFFKDSKDGYSYEGLTGEMQTYFNDIANSEDSFAANAVKASYPYTELSPIDNRIGSQTKNYFINSYSFGKTELSNDKYGKQQKKTFGYKGYFDPYSNSIQVSQNNMLDENGNPMSDLQVKDFYSSYAKSQAGMIKAKAINNQATSPRAVPIGE